MLRGALQDFKGLDHDPDFHWRGTNVTRIENLSDIVFALALGMLISGVDAPRDVSGLRVFLINIVPTALGFIVLLALWHRHYTFFRRYGVADKTIIILNAVLIFVVLFMAYPLRFAFDSLFAFAISLFTGDLSRSAELGIMTYDISGEIIAYFALFFATAFAVFALMLGHVLKKADLLVLSPYELAVTRQLRLARAGQCLICLIVAGLAWFTVLNATAAAGFGLFFLAYLLAEKRHPSKQLKTAHTET